MLVLKRNEGQWVEIVHRSGDVLRIRAYAIQAGPGPGRVNLAFDDDARHFDIQRPERRRNDPTDAAANALGRLGTVELAEGTFARVMRASGLAPDDAAGAP